ncbi:MAG: RimK family alpha-L-glutamate ligase [Candidatus Micrarchaeota archaeon]
MLNIGFQYTMLTAENMAIKNALEASGARVSFINDEQGIFSLDVPADAPAAPTSPAPSGPSPQILTPESLGLDVLIARSSSLSRSLYSSYLFESAGTPVVNSHKAQQICGDKALSSDFLLKSGIPTPAVLLAFSPKSALAAVEKMGYPCVIKPPVGSWGRMVCKINDKHAAEAVVSLKDSLGSYSDKVYYVQQYVDKPARDIRVFVAGEEIVYSVYRHANSEDMFITNLNAGATSQEMELPPDMKETVHKVCDALGAGIYGIDIVEGKSGGFYVLEVNHAPEFSKAVKNKIPNVAGKIVQFALSQAKK